MSEKIKRVRAYTLKVGDEFKLTDSGEWLTVIKFKDNRLYYRPYLNSRKQENISANSSQFVYIRGLQ